MKRVRALFICADPVGESMAGVAIRAYELARVVSAYADVTLAANARGSTSLSGIELVTYSLRDPKALKAHIAEADVVVCHPQWPTVARWLKRSGARLIFDVYDPEPFEVLEFLAGRPRIRSLIQTLTIDRFTDAFRNGDHFMCATEKQRDLWLGLMLAGRLIRPSTYDGDPDLRGTIDVVPFGLSSREPSVSTGLGARARFGFSSQDDVILWNGGIWSWLDADSAIRAIGELVRNRPRARLVFMGAAFQGRAQQATQHAQALSRELGLLDRHVFFNDGWVPYHKRDAWLLDADCAVSTHREHLETRFAFRTRVLDCFWTGLPIVCTRGDELADRVERDQLGATASPGNVGELADAFRSVLDRGRSSYASQLARAAQEFEWERVAAPLVRWVNQATPARDGRRLASHPATALRNAGFRTASSLLNHAGIEDWPRL